MDPLTHTLPAWQASKSEAERSFCAGDFERAARRYGECIDMVHSWEAASSRDLRDELAKLFSNQSLALQRLGRWEEAILTAQQATQKKPDWDKAWYRLGTSLVGAGDTVVAGQAFSVGLQLNPLSAQLHDLVQLMMPVPEEEPGRGEPGEESGAGGFRDAEEPSPGEASVDAESGLGEASADAESGLGEASAERDAEQPGTNKKRGQTFAPHPAKPCPSSPPPPRSSVTFVPSPPLPRPRCESPSPPPSAGPATPSPQARRRFSRLAARGNLRYSHGAYAESARCFEAARALAPPDAALEANLCAALLAQGRAGAALAAGLRACRLDPGGAQAILRAGRAAAGLGDWERARSLLVRLRRVLAENGEEEDGRKDGSRGEAGDQSVMPGPLPRPVSSPLLPPRSLLAELRAAEALLPRVESAVGAAQGALQAGLKEQAALLRQRGDPFADDGLADALEEALAEERRECAEQDGASLSSKDEASFQIKDGVSFPSNDGASPPSSSSRASPAGRPSAVRPPPLPAALRHALTLARQAQTQAPFPLLPARRVLVEGLLACGQPGPAARAAWALARGLEGEEGAAESAALAGQALWAAGLLDAAEAVLEAAEKGGGEEVVAESCYSSSSPQDTRSRSSPQDARSRSSSQPPSPSPNPPSESLSRLRVLRALWRRARSCGERGHWAEAAACLSAALSVDRSHRGAHVVLLLLQRSKARLEAAQPAQALRDARRAVSLWPEASRQLGMAEKLLEEGGLPGGALPSRPGQQQPWSLRPDPHAPPGNPSLQEEARFLAAQALLASGQPRTALAELETLHAERPALKGLHALLVRARAEAEEAARREAAARAEAEEALEAAEAALAAEEEDLRRREAEFRRRRQAAARREQARAQVAEDERRRAEAARSKKEAERAREEAMRRDGKEPSRRTPPVNPAPSTLYDVLDLARGAGSEEVRRAYRRAALRWHPDKAGAGAEAAARFKAAAEAYATLGEPRRRGAYDAALAVRDGLVGGGGRRVEATVGAEQLFAEVAKAQGGWAW